jgi:hypothetical protein
MTGAVHAAIAFVAIEVRLAVLAVRAVRVVRAVDAVTTITCGLKQSLIEIALCRQIVTIALCFDFI